MRKSVRIFIAFVAILVACSYAAWDGTSKVPKVVKDGGADYYEITSPAELIGFLDSVLVNKGGDESLKAYLKNDIVFGADTSKLCEKRWVRNEEQSLFTGEFDGRGHSIFGLNAENSLFKTVGLSAGMVRDLNIVNSSFGSDSVIAVAAIADYLHGFALNVNVVNTKVLSSVYAGGIVAQLTASEDDFVGIFNCNVVGGSVGGSVYVGGIVGNLLGRVYNSSNTARVYFADNMKGDTIQVYIGGIVGRADVQNGASLESCVNYGDVEISGTHFNMFVGGVAGEISGGAENLQNYGSITVKRSPSASYNWNLNVDYIPVGGVVGNLRLGTNYSTTVSDLLNEGNIKVSEETETRGDVFVGGVVGQSYKAGVTNALNRGAIEVHSGGQYVEVYAGGVIGKADMEYNWGSFSKVKNRGSVYAEVSYESYMGGLVGFMEGYYMARFPQLRESFNYGDVSGMCLDDYANVRVGGVLGFMKSMTVSDVYNRGNVLMRGDCFNKYVGGILGEASAYNTDSIRNVYSAAASVKGGELIGGIVGYLHNEARPFNAYFDVALADMSAFGDVDLREECPECKKTTAELQSDEVLALLNTANGTEADRRLWVRRNGYPVLSFDSLYQNDSVYFKRENFVIPPSRVEKDTLYYKISTADEMRTFLELRRLFSSKHYKVELANDIVMGKDSLHLMMRRMSVDSIGKCVSMQFDGKGHTVYGLDMERSMFHCLDSNTVVQNLTIANSRFANDLGLSAAGVAVMNNGCVRNVAIRNSLVRGGDIAAGLVARNYGTLLELKNENTSVYSQGVAGGIVGYSYEGVVSGASNSGKVSGREAGGIVGYANGYGQGPNIVTKTSNSGTVLVAGDSIVFAGGIVGYALRTTLSENYNTGLVQGSADLEEIALGGIAGRADSITSISKVGNWGRVHVISGDRVCAGGIVGRFSSRTVSAGGKLIHMGGFSEEFNYGPVYVMASKDTSYAGGIIGCATNLVLHDGYNRGVVKNEGDTQNRFTGGLVGRGYFVTLYAGYSYTDTLSGSGVGSLAYAIEGEGNIVENLYYGSDKLNSEAVVEYAEDESNIFKNVEKKSSEQMQGELDFLKESAEDQWVFGSCFPKMKIDTTTGCNVNIVKDFFEESFTDSVGYLLDVVYADSTSGSEGGEGNLTPVMESVQVQPMLVTVYDRNITVSGLPENHAVAVFDMRGRMVASARVHGAEVRLAVPRTGRYIVRSGSLVHVVSVH